MYDSVINETPLSARTNRIIGSKAPSGYLPKIQQEAGISEERLDELLRSHLIEPDLVKKDKFNEFFQKRAEKMLEMIENAMGNWYGTRQKKVLFRK